MFKLLNVLCLAVPYDNHTPSGSFESFNVRVIPFDVALQFGLPVFSSGSRHPSIPTGMLMPKTPVHEDNHSKPCNNDIGFTGQTFHMQPVSIPVRVQHASHKNFRLSFFARNRPHTVRALGSSHRISQGTPRTNTSGDRHLCYLAAFSGCFLPSPS